jgi:hypothetical protein
MCKGCFNKYCQYYEDKSWHWSFLVCRKRKWFEGTLDPDEYTYDPVTQLVLPKERAIYLIVLNKRSPLRNLARKWLSFTEKILG